MKKIFIVIFLSIILVGCQSDQTTDFNKTDKTNAGNVEIISSTSYPIYEDQIKNSQSYPYPIDTPVSEQTKPNQGPDFEIFEPVKGGETIIKGTGPANVPIKLIDVTEVGALLGSTVIDNDGTFTFFLDQSVESGHSIGLQLGDIEKTEFTESDFFYSDTYYERPLIGIIFDIVNVK